MLHLPAFVWSDPHVEQIDGILTETKSVFHDHMEPQIICQCFKLT